MLISFCEEGRIKKRVYLFNDDNDGRNVGIQEIYSPFDGLGISCILTWVCPFILDMKISMPDMDLIYLNLGKCKWA